MKVCQFRERNGGFNYVFEYDLDAYEEIVLIMPRISANKRGVNDIAWQSDGDITIWGTLSPEPLSSKALWQEIGEHYDINKCTYALKIKAGNGPCSVTVRALMN